MNLVKIPGQKKQDYDELISDGYLARVAFQDTPFPYIAPFLYVFDGRYLYFMPTKYGKKIEMVSKNPHVAVYIEELSPDLATHRFVTLRGRVEEVSDEKKRLEIRESFAEMISQKKLSHNILPVLGIDPEESVSAITGDERTVVWRLVGVEEIVALKNL